MYQLPWFYLYILFFIELLIPTVLSFLKILHLKRIFVIIVVQEIMRGAAVDLSTRVMEGRNK